MSWLNNLRASSDENKNFIRNVTQNYQLNYRRTIYSVHIISSMSTQGVAKVKRLTLPWIEPEYCLDRVWQGVVSKRPWPDTISEMLKIAEVKRRVKECDCYFWNFCFLCPLQGEGQSLWSGLPKRYKGAKCLQGPYAMITRPYLTIRHPYWEISVPYWKITRHYFNTLRWLLM